MNCHLMHREETTLKHLFSAGKQWLFMHDFQYVMHFNSCFLFYRRTGALQGVQTRCRCTLQFWYLQQSFLYLIKAYHKLNTGTT